MIKRIHIWIIVLALLLIAAACSAPQTDNEAGDATGVPVVSTGESTATGAAGDTLMTPTAGEGTSPAQETQAATAAPTLSGESASPEAGGTAVIPQTGPGDAGLPDDVDELIRVARTAGYTVDLGEAAQVENITVPGQTLLIDGEEVQIFTFPSAEEVEVLASQLENPNPEEEPQFYKLGNMLVRYAGREPAVRDLLEDVLGAQAAGQ